MLELKNATVVYSESAAGPGGTAQEMSGSLSARTKAIDVTALSVKEGESIALIGGNGAGKTTLLLAIAGVVELSGGTVEVEGIALTKKTVNEIRKRIGMVFQNPDDQLFMPLVSDDIAFGCRNLGMPADLTAVQTDEILAKLNISHLRSRSSLRLSAGEKRMAAIATVLVMKPSLLMFDEPTAFLDHRARRALIGILKKLDHTKIVATHDLAFAAEVCSRVIILKDGRIAADGKLNLLYDKVTMQNCGLEVLNGG